MKITLKHIAIAFVFGLLFIQSASAQVRIAASVENSADIYLGQRFVYYIIVEGSDTPGAADITPLSQYDPQSSGTQNYSSSSITLVNGKRTMVKKKQFVMSYQLLAASPGTITLPAVEVTIGGAIHTTNPVELQVQRPAATDKMEMQMSLSPAKCYTAQPILFTVKWLIHSDIVNSVGDFNFSVPAFSSGNFFIEDTDSAIAGNYNKSVNGVGVMVAQQPIKYKGADYAQVLFSKVLIPKRTGKIKLGSAITSIQLAVGKQRSNGFGSRIRYKQFICESQPLVLDVLPLPAENKPPAFYGLVGKYTIETAASPTEVHMGDPIELSIKVSGSNYLKPVQWPKLNTMDGFENFKLPAERSSPIIQNGSKVFTLTIRANNKAVTDIPPISLIYFDTENGTYKTIASEAIALEVAATKKLTTGDIEGTSIVSANRPVEAIKNGISANVESLDALINQEFSPIAALLLPSHLILWALPLAVLLAGLIVRAATNKSPGRIATSRRRRARPIAIGALKKLPLSDNDRKRAILIKTMRDYIGQRFDRPSGSLTADDCYTELLNRTGDEDIAYRWRQIFENCQQSFYAGQQGDFDIRQSDEVIELLKTIDRKATK